MPRARGKELRRFFRQHHCHRGLRERSILAISAASPAQARQTRPCTAKYRAGESLLSCRGRSDNSLKQFAFPCSNALLNALNTANAYYWNIARPQPAVKTPASVPCQIRRFIDCANVKRFSSAGWGRVHLSFRGRQDTKVVYHLRDVVVASICHYDSERGKSVCVLRFRRRQIMPSLREWVAALFCPHTCVVPVGLSGASA